MNYVFTYCVIHKFRRVTETAIQLTHKMHLKIRLYIRILTARLRQTNRDVG